MFENTPNAGNAWLYAQDTFYYCHSSYTNGSRFVDVTPKHKWPLLIEICMTIASLFSPFLLTLISQQNPPKVQKGKRYLAIDSDLPVGVHYCLFHSCRKRKCVLIIRTFIGISIISVTWNTTIRCALICIQNLIFSS